MSCPLLRRAQLPQCRAVADGPVPVGREIVASYCRGRYGDCPAYRYVRAAGHPLNPADFRAWVVEGISPGRVDPYPASPAHGTDTP
jgi:hypothetical protein